MISFARQRIASPEQHSLLLTLTLVLVSSGFAQQPGFKQVAGTGVNESLPFEEDSDRAYLYYTGHAAGSVCLGDVNSDGRTDLYVSRGLGANKLYLNRGDWKFEAVSGPYETGNSWGTGATLVDIDADGDLDICQTNYDAPIQFFSNDGTGTFREVPNAFGLGITDASLTVSFADPDNDGDLDAFVLCNTYFRPNGRPATPPFSVVNGQPKVKPEFAKYYRVVRERHSGKWTMDEYGRRDYFLLNEGSRSQPRFRDISETTEIAKTGFGLSCLWWDFDQDGLLDLSVSNDFLSPDRLFKNLGKTDGIPSFRDVTDQVLPTIAWSSMGSGIADINNDGWADLLTVDMAPRSHYKAKLNMGEMAGERRWVMENGWPRQVMRNHLYVNAGKGKFREEAWMRGIANTDWSWAVKWGDYDEDGWNDVLITNGMTRNFTDSDHHLKIGSLQNALVGKSQWDLFRDQPAMQEANVVFQNRQGRGFKEVGREWGLDLLGISYGAASGDLDGDGDLDLVVTRLGEPPCFYENQLSHRDSPTKQPPHERLRVRLVGTISNVMGIGAKVTVSDKVGIARTRWMLPWMGFQSQDDNVLHFGLGTQPAKQLHVTWPSGLQQTLPIANKQRSIVLTEPRAPPRLTLQSQSQSPWWQARNLPWQHVDAPFDDFHRQPLLPAKLSQQGPCIAIGDLDSDGTADAYLGGGAGQPAGLLVNLKGKLRVGAADWGAAAASEDVDALWFDADQDGDQDLYVVSGSTEFPINDSKYRDRFYRNDSKSGLIRLEHLVGALPDLRDSGSCVAAADYDGDGDLDLFVGSRSVVGQYPVSPASRLLRNDSNRNEIRFTDVTAQAAPQLARAGLVTDASWADLDNDHDQDLVLATEWGPIRIFWNHDGVHLAEGTDATMDARSGWWQAVTVLDLDMDGDQDILAGNVGWNTKYGRPSSTKPAELYYGDMDGSGTPRIVEAKRSGRSLLPVRGRSCSSHAIPDLARKFTSYRQFALSDLTGIYGDTCLQSAKRFVATELASGAWINQGNQRFTWNALPWEVQASQVNDFAVADFDSDGNQEILVAQNEDSREPETSLWRFGLGAVLRYRDGDWQVIPNDKTGLAIRESAQQIGVLQNSDNAPPGVLVGRNSQKLMLLLPTNSATDHDSR